MLVALALTALAAPPVVLVPTGGPAATCAARMRLDAAIELSPGLRRAPLAAEAAPPDLAAARAARGAAAGLDARAVAGGFEVRLALPDRSARATGADLARAVLEVWPKSLPPLEPRGLTASPSQAALEAACAKDAEAAYAAAGTAVALGISDRLAPPSSARRGTMMQRWAWARAQASEPRGCARAQPILRSTVQALERGLLAPIWRRAPKGGPRPTAITRLPGAWILFEDGRFTAVDPDSGRQLWRRRADTAEPRPVELHEGHLAIVSERGLLALKTATGTAAWRVDLRSPAAELAVVRGQVVVSTAEKIVALDVRSGAERWAHDGLSRPAAGPVHAQGRIVAPLYSRLDLLDPTTGAVLGKVELGDEITGPLVPAADGGIWVPVGADEIVQVDPRRAEIVYRADELFGASWPPAVIAGRLVTSVPASRGQSVLAIVDPRAGATTRVRARGLTAPILGMADFSGVVHSMSRPWAVVARDFAGKERWRARQPSAVRALEAPGDLVVAGVGPSVVVLDRKRGRALWRAELEAPVLDVRYDQDGGLVALDNGALYGLPGGRDPRLSATLRAARLDLAACQSKLRQHGAAITTARRVLARRPADLDALALVAEIESARRRPEAAGAWLAVLRGSHPADPVHRRAADALATTMGLERRVRPATPVRGLVALERGRLTARGEGGTVVLDPTEGTPLHVPVSGEVRFDAETRTLTRTGTSGPGWSQTLEPAGLGRLVAGDDLLVLSTTTAAGMMWIGRAATGETLWSHPLGAPARRAWPNDGAVLVQTDKRLLGVDPTAERPRFSRPALGADAEVLPHRGGWLVREGARLSALTSQGRRRFVLRLPANLRGLAVSSTGELAAYWTARELVVVEMARGRSAKTWRGLDVRELVLDGGRAVALTGSGALLSLDLAKVALPTR